VFKGIIEIIKNSILTLYIILYFITQTLENVATI